MCWVDGFGAIRYIEAGTRAFEQICDLEVVLNTPPMPEIPPLPGITHVVAVASGKGGVGKSTTAANLAVAMAQTGAKIGLMDADIYGPNVPIMMGSKEQPEMRDGKMIPLERHGVKLISLGLIAGDGVPVIWRGPMLAKMVTQFLQDVLWAPLDCLVIDLPPGTGDVQLTLTQTAPMDGAVIVTTPPKVALEDVRRGVEMFRTVKVPVLGVIENMSSYVCSKCGTETSIFGHGGGKHTADLYEVPFLGEIPLHPQLQMGSDMGVPLVASDPETPISLRYKEIAQQILSGLSKH